jgi:hypothetical protein
MYAWLSEIYNEKRIETTLLVRYNDIENYIICDPGGTFILDANCYCDIEPGNDVIVYSCNNVVIKVERGHKKRFVGFIESITNVYDTLLPTGMYYELHPKKNVPGQVDLPVNTRLIIPTKHTKIINPKKPIMLEYRKGPCKNYYEVIL